MVIKWTDQLPNSIGLFQQYFIVNQRGGEPNMLEKAHCTVTNKIVRVLGICTLYQIKVDKVNGLGLELWEFASIYMGGLQLQ